MKLKLTLIILSVIIVLAAGFIAWWMIFNASFQMEAPIQGDNGITGYAILSPEHAVLAELARYGSILLFLIGIALLEISFFRKAKIQLTLGIISAAMALFIGLYGFPNVFIGNSPSGGSITMYGLDSPGSTESLARYAAVVVFLFGLSVFGLSIAQLIQLKKKAIV